MLIGDLSSEVDFKHLLYERAQVIIKLLRFYYMARYWYSFAGIAKHLKYGNMVQRLQ
jgi:hypothetical protein